MLLVCHDFALLSHHDPNATIIFIPHFLCHTYTRPRHAMPCHASSPPCGMPLSHSFSLRNLAFLVQVDNKQKATLPNKGERGRKNERSLTQSRNTWLNRSRVGLLLLLFDATNLTLTHFRMLPARRESPPCLVFLRLSYSKCLLYGWLTGTIGAVTR